MNFDTMGNAESTTETKASGPMSNANNITIMDKIEEHSDNLSVFLIIIVTILLIHVAIKLYKMNRSCIQKSERMKSRINLESV